MTISAKTLDAVIDLIKKNKSHSLQLDINVERVVECCMDDSGGIAYSAKLFDNDKVFWTFADNPDDEEYLGFEDVLRLMVEFELVMSAPDSYATHLPL